MKIEDKDLKIEFCSKAEANWKSVLEQAEKMILEGETNLEINKLIAGLAKKRVAEEQAKFK